MTEQQSCPQSKERRDSSELRTCKITSCLCIDSFWRSESYYLGCPVFLEYQKTQRNVKGKT